MLVRLKVSNAVARFDPSFWRNMLGCNVSRLGVERAVPTPAEKCSGRKEGHSAMFEMDLAVNGTLITPTNGGGVKVEQWDAEREENVHIELVVTRS